eukprot:TRINITY_DN17375_c0_g1_i1.p1 TRINITY_DN17375_c0_g1~~TRINITY_DN17375_c0_g1_i1.p1  ORF type:complete len:318 (+),score=41.09 TRINITY_DN17375_c0_g1_i1:58-1011(+)
MSPRLFYKSSVCLVFVLFLEEGPSQRLYVVDKVPLSPRIMKRQISDTPLELGAGALGQSDSVVFLSNNNTQILAHQGSSVTLSCRLTKPPNSGMVTWTRRLEHEHSLQVLSIGDFTHISDSRFLIAKKPLDNDWQLKIQSVSSYDSGEYQCQATTHPPSHISVRVIVVDAYAEIKVEDAENLRNPDSKGPKEMFIESGSQLKLKCELKKATEKPKFIFWYHNQSMVNYSPQTGKMVTKYNDGWGSILIINSASSSDGGNYTCSPQNIIPDSVIVTIMDGEGKSAAVYKDSVTSAGTNGQKSTEFLFIVILCSSLLQL